MPLRRRSTRFQRRSRPYSRASKKRRFTRRKKIRTAKKNFRKNQISVPRGPTPTSVFVKLRVLVPFNHTVVANTYNSVTQLFNFLNPIVPSSLIATQPTGWDQWSTLYQQFTVLAAKCSVTFGLNQAYTGFLSGTLLPSTMTSAQMVAAMDGGAGSGLGQGMGPLSNQYAKTKYLTHYQGSKSISTIKAFMKTRTLFQTKDVMDDPDFTGTTSSFTGGASKPVNDAWFYFIQQQGNGTAAAVLNCRASLTYFIKFSSPVVLGSS